MVLLDYFVYLLFATIMPRFLISVRELYVRDLKGQYRGMGIDTGFGVFTHPISSQDQAVSTILFANDADGSGQDQVAEGDAGNSEGAIRSEIVRDDAHQV